MKNTNKNEQIHAWKETCACVGTGTETCGCQKMPGLATILVSCGSQVGSKQRLTSLCFFE